jgi:glycosyltransferase involved in cell wall biosynthesis
VKILHLLNTIDPAFGGPVEAARQCAAGAPEGVSIEVLTLDPDASKWAHQWPVRIHLAGKCFTRYRYTPRLVPWLREHGSRFDAVVVHGIWHYQTVGAWQGLRGSGVPYFVILHGMLDPWFKQTHPLKHVKKALFWHTLVHKALQDAAAVLFLCEEERKTAPRTFAMRLRADAIVPLGIQTPPSLGEGSPCDQFALQFPALRGKRVLLFLGRICRMKACDSLLHAFAKTCRVQAVIHLLICGPDSEGWQSELIRMAKSLGIADRVSWAGPLYGERKWAALRAADLFVLPSHCETFPVAVLEALACQTPVLITDRVGIYREIQDGDAGLVCKDEKQSLEEALGTWFSLGGDHRAAYRSAAYRCFQKHFELNSAVAQQLKVIRQFSQSANSSTLTLHKGRIDALG